MVLLNLFLLLIFNSLVSSKSFAATRDLVPMESMILERSSLLNGGSISSFGGGDTVDARKFTAWFYGNDEITTCYNSISSFGVPNKKIEASILKSIQKWKTYFKEKKINKNLKVPINTNFKFVGKCNGGEDLDLYFGTGPIFGNLRDLKARQSLHKPIAYVNKTHISKNLMWSQGYIRFVEQEKYSLSNGQNYPKWSENSNLDVFVLHELGHVLGFKHVEGSLMAENIVKTKIINNAPLKSTIDQEEELYTCYACEKTYLLTKKSTDPITHKKSSFKVIGSDLYYTYHSGKAQKLNLLQTLKRKTEKSFLSMFEDSNAKDESSYLYFFKFTDRAQKRTFTLAKKGFQLILAENGTELAVFTQDSKETSIAPPSISPETPHSNALAVNLLQESKDIVCSTKGVFNLTIDKRDGFVKTNSGQTYRSVEFLDSAILLKDNSSFALIQLTSKSEALFVTGNLFNFTEGHCKKPKGTPSRAFKQCKNANSAGLYWSSEYLSLQDEKTAVKHYGVYPNDGTYFIATQNERATALIDYGSRFQVLNGSVKKLTCKYK